jgi:hypothetical protein
MCRSDQQWTEALPLPLLEFRTAFEEELQASVAELAYGEPLSIPGELLTPTTDPVDPAHLITELRQHMVQQHATPTQLHSCTATSRSARLPPSGRNAHSVGAHLQWPLPGPGTERKKHCKLSCAAGPPPCQPEGLSRRT